MTQPSPDAKALRALQQLFLESLVICNVYKFLYVLIHSGKNLKSELLVRICAFLCPLEIPQGKKPMITCPRQEAHLVSSLQDLFKDQEKRITTAVLVAWYAITNSYLFLLVTVP